VCGLPAQGFCTSLERSCHLVQTESSPEKYFFDLGRPMIPLLLPGLATFHCYSCEVAEITFTTVSRRDASVMLRTVNRTV
jgi:hypothetical protein